MKILKYIGAVWFGVFAIVGVVYIFGSMFTDMNEGRIALGFIFLIVNGLASAELFVSASDS